MRLMQRPSISHETPAPTTGNAADASLAETAARDRARVAELLRKRRPNKTTLSPAVLAELDAMGDAAVPGLIAATDVKRFRCPSISWLFAVSVIIGWLFLLYSVRNLPLLFLLNWIYIGVLQKVGGLYKRVVGRYTRGDLPVVRVLMEIGGIRSLAGVISTYDRTDDESARIELRVGLMRLLPRLTRADEDLLQERHRRILRRLVGPGYGTSKEADVEFVIAIIKGLVQSGDLGLLPTLRCLARGARDAEVRRMAAMGVTELEGRIVAWQGTDR